MLTGDCTRALVVMAFVIVGWPVAVAIVFKGEKWMLKWKRRDTPALAPTLKQQEALALKEEGLGPLASAKALGLAMGSVKGRLARARARSRQRQLEWEKWQK